MPKSQASDAAALPYSFGYSDTNLAYVLRNAHGEEFATLNIEDYGLGRLNDQAAYDELMQTGEFVARACNAWARQSGS